MRSTNMTTRHVTIGGLSAAVLLTIGCNADPVYLAPAEALEIGAPGSDLAVAQTQIELPIRIETDVERELRGTLEGQLGFEVPFVRRLDLDISLEWTIRNLDVENPAMARIHVNGANEYFAYVPSAFVVDPDEEEEPPPLAGDIPILLEPGQTRNGVFREDDLLEAAIDLELITRGGLNPFAAMLEIHEDDRELNDGMGTVIPFDQTAQLVRLDIVFLGDGHMVLEYAVRVRDQRDPELLHEDGLAADSGELTTFSPTDFTPPPLDGA